MKKTLLATLILSSFVSGALSAATVYDKENTKLSIGGRAEVRALFSDAVDGSMLDKSRARINFEGETKIAETLTGFAFMEYELDRPDGSTEIDNRYLFAGLSTVAGDFSYGRQDTASVQLSNMTDIASYHSGVQQIIDAASDKQSNNFVFANNSIKNLSLKANYIANGSKTVDAAAEDSFGLSARYSMDTGVDLGISYADQDQENQITLGAGYTFEDLYLATTYAMGSISDTNDFTSLEVAAQYKFTKEFRMIATYAMADEEEAGVTTDTADYAALEGQYRFNDSLRTYASYKLNNITDGDDELVAGLRYNF
ncbi:porin [Psychromonas sp. MB-3u-54]|uniref:porin n=1 Tax=Psychromonas sp. MB-3u-54 TaxID=2058319 RepID=UPI000C33B686|nr:porin [Psychromonas sp. MB-3u-54]PKH02396.1 porin [Psychromonas sp. MB-3u-54]